MTVSIPDKKKRRRVGFIAVIIIVSACISIWNTQCKKPKPDTRPIRMSGEVIAHETLKLIGNKGEIAVVTMDTDNHRMQFKAFKRVLNEQPNVTLAATEKIAPQQLARSEMGSGISAEQFFQLLEKYPKTAAIVSMVGPPILKDADINRIGPNVPKLLVYAPMVVGVRKLLEEQVIQVAVVPRMMMGPPMAGPGAFNAPQAQGGDGLFEVLTPQTIQSRPIFEPPPPTPQKSK